MGLSLGVARRDGPHRRRGGRDAGQQEEAAMTAKVSRRQFLKLSAAALGGAALVTDTKGVGASSGVDPAAVPSMLIDISRCVGCGNCQRSCIEANGLQADSENREKAACGELHVPPGGQPRGRQDPLREAPVHALPRRRVRLGVPRLGAAPDQRRADRLQGGPLPGLPLLHGELPVQRADLRVGRRHDARNPQVHVLHRAAARRPGTGMRGATVRRAP